MVVGQNMVTHAEHSPFLVSRNKIDIDAADISLILPSDREASVWFAFQDRALGAASCQCIPAPRC